MKNLWNVLNISFLRSKLFVEAINLAELVATAAIESQDVLMMSPKRLPVGNCEECDAHSSAVLVHAALNIYRNSARALVQNGKLWMMVEESRHGHSLLLTTAQHVYPILDRVQALLALLHQSTQLHNVQEVYNVLIGLSTSLHLLVSMWIDNLIAKASERHVRPLRNVEEFTSWWFDDLATP